MKHVNYITAHFTWFALVRWNGQCYVLAIFWGRFFQHSIIYGLRGSVIMNACLFKDAFLLFSCLLLLLQNADGEIELLQKFRYKQIIN